MKTPFSLLILLFSVQLMAQKEDYNWLIGYSGKSSNPIFGITRLQFDDKDSLKIISEEKSIIDFSDACSAISDKTGQLALYTNCSIVMNREHDTLTAGKLIIEESVNMIQGVITLPFPEQDSLYLIVHQEPGIFFVPPNNHVSGAIETYYSIVDMSKNSGKGKVIERSKKLTDKVNYFGYGHISAVKQPDGINWWIFLYEPWYDKIHRFELTKLGITYVDEQKMNIKMIEGVGPALFSPDATKYVMYIDEAPNKDRYVDIFDFDRCKGQLKHKERIILGKRNGLGASISPNSRYLYISMIDELYQFDLKAPKIAPTLKVVAKIDDFKENNFVLGIRYMQLAPDNKIYITASGGSRYLHVIEKPDLPDTLCSVKQHKIFLPTYNGTMPYFPNFRQKPINCTISTKDESDFESKIILYPNPANNQITIENKELNSTIFNFKLFDMQGRQVFNQTLNNAKENIAFNLPNGLYFWRVFDENRQVGQGKLVVME